MCFLFGFATSSNSENTETVETQSTIETQPTDSPATTIISTSAPSNTQPVTNCLSTFCFVRNTDPLYDNTTDIDENFLDEIEDTGPRTYHTLQSRRITEEEIPLNTVTQQPQVGNKIKCIHCDFMFTKRGMTEHVNARHPYK